MGKNAWMKMNRSVSFTQFIKNDKNFKSQTPELKLQSIFFLFDNNDEGILRKHEVRQIIFTLFLLKKEPVKVKDIEDIVSRVMKTKMNSNFEYITMDNFVNNFLA